MLVLKLGWRNLWRNSRRSLINISAIATAFAFIILLLGLGEGMKRQMLENGTGLMLGHLQLHHPDYLPDRSFYDTLGRAEARSSDLVREVESKGGVLAASPRVYGFALLSTGENSSGGQLMGILPGSEHRLTTILDELVGEGDREKGTEFISPPFFSSGRAIGGVGGCFPSSRFPAPVFQDCCRF